MAYILIAPLFHPKNVGQNLQRKYLIIVVDITSTTGSKDNFILLQIFLPLFFGTFFEVKSHAQKAIL